MALEVAVLAWRWRCAPVHYFRYGLYRKGHGLPDVLAYLPETVLYYRQLPRVSADEILLDDKTLTKAVLATAGVRMPGTIGLIRRGRLTWLEACAEGRELVLKPARHTSGGDGIQLVTRTAAELRSLDGTPVRVGELAGDWIIEERIDPSPATAGWGGGGLSTFRTYTVTSADGCSEVVGVVFKVGMHATPVDNAHAGGIYVRADTDAERLVGSGMDERMTVHAADPISGQPFDGATMPGLGRLAAAARAAAAAFPRTPFLGWDIALAEDGEPVVIEGNSSPGLTPLQRSHGGMAKTLVPHLDYRQRR
jgi:hypothetical protein